MTLFTLCPISSGADFSEFSNMNGIAYESQSLTFFTGAISALVNIGIGCVKRMPLPTLNLSVPPCMEAFTTHHIDLQGDDIHMGRINTRSNAAEMIYYKIRRNRSDQPSITDSVRSRLSGISRNIRLKVENTISVLVFRGEPHPARRAIPERAVLINLRPESFLGIHLAHNASVPALRQLWVTS